MRKSYPGYYCPTKGEFDAMWKTCLFVLDTNIILDLFRKSGEYRERMLLILEELSGQLWMPHQVGLEYHKQRRSTISEQTKPINEIKETLEKLAKHLRNTTRHPFVDDEQFAKIATRLERYSKKLAKELDAKKEEYLSQGGNKAIENQIGELFEGKIGRSYCAESLREVHEEWKKRHDEHRPLCRQKEEDAGKYGDFVIWSQLIDKAKEAATPIIFITNDSDWMQERREGKTFGPHPDLINEMDMKASVQFYVYRADKFIMHAGERLGKKISKEVIEEAQKILYSSLTLFDGYTAFQAAMEQYQAQFNSIQRAFQAAVNLPTIDAYEAFQAAMQGCSAAPSFIQGAIQEAVREYLTLMGLASGEETDSSGSEEEESPEEEDNHPED